MFFLIIIFNNFFFITAHFSIILFKFQRILILKFIFKWFMTILNILIFEIRYLDFSFKLFNFALNSINLWYRTFAWLFNIVSDACHLGYFWFVELFRVQMRNISLAILVNKIVFLLILRTLITLLQLIIDHVLIHQEVFSLSLRLIINIASRHNVCLLLLR